MSFFPAADFLAGMLLNVILGAGTEGVAGTFFDCEFSPFVLRLGIGNRVTAHGSLPVHGCGQGAGCGQGQRLTELRLTGLLATR